ncbi:hypothetical protein H5410_050340 [Solanum commersonii]|uniref:Uncharacterized protein n=1 Tax=Solanum commersonii TaxID=4109 RepID=A0A9J5WV75_SOLCO|nr:hypothetical protein H5410_050340 [Solanum commersonii]
MASDVPSHTLNLNKSQNPPPEGSIQFEDQFKKEVLSTSESQPVQRKIVPSSKGKEKVTDKGKLKSKLYPTRGTT